MPDSLFLTRVLLENYKSIAFCDVRLRPVTYLIGPNGSGKSNFLDALRFISDSLNFSLEKAVAQRGGYHQIRRRGEHAPNYFSIRIEFELPNGTAGFYVIRIGPSSRGGYGYEVETEECHLYLIETGEEQAYFRVEQGKVITSEPIAPAALSDRLYLVNASGMASFRPVYDALSRMVFYNFNPERIRDLQQPNVGELLSRDGDNVAGILAAIEFFTPDIKRRIVAYLATVVPGIASVDTKAVGPTNILEFRQYTAAEKRPMDFPASSMSDGTLRALGILVALFQTGNGNGPGISLVGIEEPETSLHPAAVGVLLDALEEATMTRQVLITSHSADLLDNPRIDPDALLAVVMRDGKTEIGPISAASRSVIRDHLFTAGELLRIDQIAPDLETLHEAENAPPQFFSEVAA